MGSLAAAVARKITTGRWMSLDSGFDQFSGTISSPQSISRCDATRNQQRTSAKRASCTSVPEGAAASAMTLAPAARGSGAGAPVGADGGAQPETDPTRIDPKATKLERAIEMNATRQDDMRTRPSRLCKMLHRKRIERSRISGVAP
jgi:hypothetical protein